MAELKAKNIEHDLSIPVGQYAESIVATALHLLFDNNDQYRGAYGARLVRVTLSYDYPTEPERGEHTHEVTRK